MDIVILRKKLEHFPGCNPSFVLALLRNGMTQIAKLFTNLESCQGFAKSFGTCAQLFASTYRTSSCGTDTRNVA